MVSVPLLAIVSVWVVPLLNVPLIIKLETLAATSKVILFPEAMVTAAPEVGTLPPNHVPPVFQLPVAAFEIYPKME